MTTITINAEAAADARDAWDGEGYYRIGWSDGGMDWTSDGPVWYDSEGELAEELEAAYADATETHLPYAERVSPTTFATMADAIEWVDLTLSTSEGYPDDYDMEAIAEEVTEWQDGRFVLTALDDDLFWGIVRRHDRTNRTKAEFRAMRETLGVTQQRLADDLGVRVLSVKRWESPRYPQFAPGEAWGLLDDLMAVQDGAVEAAVAQARQEAEGTRVAVLPYWSSQSDYAEHHDGAAGSDASWTEANATSRRVAAVLRGLGYEVRWADGRDDHTR